MQLHQVNWRDIESVTAYAQYLAMRAPSVRQIIFWNGKNYQITHKARLGIIQAQGHRVVAFVGGNDGD